MQQQNKPAADSSKSALQINCGSCKTVIKVPAALIEKLLEVNKFTCPKCKNQQSIQITDEAREKLRKRCRQDLARTQQPPTHHHPHQAHHHDQHHPHAAAPHQQWASAQHAAAMPAGQAQQLPFQVALAQRRRALLQNSMEADSDAPYSLYMNRKGWQAPYLQAGLQGAAGGFGAALRGADGDAGVDLNEDDFGMEDLQTFEDYKPAKLKLEGVSDDVLRHPDPVVETSSLAAVQPPDITYDIHPDLKEIAAAGKLSGLQMESIVYACQRHEQRLPDNTRAGFFIGDGAGVGKGRTIAGLVKENWSRLRRKHLWLSIASDLKFDAQRDLTDADGADISVHALNKLPYGNLARPSDPRKAVVDGVIFLTYQSLIATSSKLSRLQQLVDWCGADEFDGLIIFDECHKAKNLMPEAGSEPTRTGKAVLELQNMLPNGRVVYCSATGASEPRNMAYMVRLGLWGEGNSSFGEFRAFLNAVEPKSRGMSTLELVAMEMKARGMYVCRTLSFSGAEFSTEFVNMEPEMQEMHTKACEMWKELWLEFNRAVASLEPHEIQRPTKLLLRQFWGTQQRFFRHMCMAAKVPALVRICKQALEDGMCVVVGLQSTGEARTQDVVQERGEVLDDFVSGPKELLLKMVEDWYPMPAKPNGMAVIDGIQPQNEKDELQKELLELKAAAGADKVDNDGSPCEDNAGQRRSGRRRATMNVTYDEKKIFRSPSPSSHTSSSGSDNDKDFQSKDKSTRRQPQRASGKAAAKGKQTNNSVSKADGSKSDDSKSANDEDSAGAASKAASRDGSSKGTQNRGGAKPAAKKRKTVVASVSSSEAEENDDDDEDEESDEESEAHSDAEEEEESADNDDSEFAASDDDDDHNDSGGSTHKRRGHRATNKRNTPDTKRTISNAKRIKSEPNLADTTHVSGLVKSESSPEMVDVKPDVKPDVKCGVKEELKKEEVLDVKMENAFQYANMLVRSNMDGDDKAGFASQLESAQQLMQAQLEKYKTCLARKQQLKEAIQQLTLPFNPLDDIIDQLGGPGNVAEMTGRKARLLRQTDGTVKWEARNAGLKNAAGAGTSLELINVHERNEFLEGNKLIAIISEAASAGISLHAERRTKGCNRRRVHITLELPWSADKALQQLGRSHRANQVTAPMYKLMFTQLGGERRFAACVARRLESMGALTQGDRRSVIQNQRANAGGMSLGDFSEFESQYGKHALSTMYQYVTQSNEFMPPKKEHMPPVCVVDQEEDAIAVMSWPTFLQEARRLLMRMNIFRPSGLDWQHTVRHLLDGSLAIDAHHGGIDKPDLKDVQRFLNRMLALPAPKQELLFDWFSNIMQEVVITAKREGKYDEGISSIAASSLLVDGEPAVMLADKHSTAQTLHFSVKADRGVSWQAALDMLQAHAAVLKDTEEAASSAVFSPTKPRKPSHYSGFWRSKSMVVGNKYLTLLALEVPGSMPRAFRVTRPATGTAFRPLKLYELQQRYNQLEPKQVQPHWEEAFDNANKEGGAGNRLCEYHVFCGMLLPVWSIIEANLKSSLRQQDQRLRVVRIVTTDEERRRIVGILIPNEVLPPIEAAIEELKNGGNPEVGSALQRQGSLSRQNSSSKSSKVPKLPRRRRKKDDFLPPVSTTNDDDVQVID